MSTPFLAFERFLSMKYLYPQWFEDVIFTVLLSVRLYISCFLYNTRVNYELPDFK